MRLRRSWWALAILVSGLAGAHAEPLLGQGEEAPGGEPRGPVPLQRVRLPQDWPWQLTIWTSPSVGEISWRSAASLIRTYLLSHLKTRVEGGLDMGHMFVHLRTAGNPQGKWSGMSDADPREMLSLVKDHGYGLGVLAADVAGRLHGGERTEAVVRRKLERGGIAFMRFLVSEATGRRLEEYMTGYEARGAGAHYGGANRPRHGEGGGCGSYAVSFLEVAGLLSSELDQAWGVVERIPADMFGGPGTGRFVSAWSLLEWVSLGRDWARNDEPGVMLQMWDPSQAYRWILDQHRSERAEPTGKWFPEDRGLSGKGLAVDARHEPTPEDSIWREDPPGTPHPLGRQRSVARRVDG